MPGHWSVWSLASGGTAWSAGGSRDVLDHAGRVLGIDEAATKASGDHSTAERACARDEEASSVPIGHGTHGDLVEARPGARGSTRRGTARGRGGPTSHTERSPARRPPRRPCSRPSGPAWRADRGAPRPTRRCRTRRTRPRPTTTARGQDSGKRGDRRARRGRRARLSASLSFVPNRLDEDVLGAGRLQADDERSDRDDERWRAPDDAGDQLRRGDRQAGRKRTRRARAPMRERRLVGTGMRDPRKPSLCRLEASFVPSGPGP